MVRPAQRVQISSQLLGTAKRDRVLIMRLNLDYWTGNYEVGSIAAMILREKVVADNTRFDLRS